MEDRFERMLSDVAGYAQSLKDAGVGPKERREKGLAKLRETLSREFPEEELKSIGARYKDPGETPISALPEPLAHLARSAMVYEQGDSTRVRVAIKALEVERDDMGRINGYDDCDLVEELKAWMAGPEAWEAAQG